MASAGLGRRRLVHRRDDADSASLAQRMAPPEVSGRDRRTLEIRYFLPLPRPGQDKSKSKSRDKEVSYTLDAYFYFPHSFGVNSATLPREQFYRSANSYMRLHAPGLKLSELADLDNDNNPGTALRNQLPLLMTERAPSSESLAMLAQLLGAELADAATFAVQRLRRLVVAAELSGVVGETGELLERACAETCSDILKALGSVRRLRAKTSAYRALMPPALLDGLCFAEEYASAIVDEQLAELATIIESSVALRDGLCTATRLRARLGLTIEQVNRRRMDQGFAMPWDDRPEYFSYRMALLKDELERALYVDTRRLVRDPFYQNSAAVVAASLAATWATLAQIPLLSTDLATEHRLLVLGFAVGAYVLKDRIKEWTRLILSSRILRWDHDRKVLGNALAPVGFGEFSGRARERMRFIEPGQVPADVATLRLAHRKMRMLASEREHVLHYHRWLTFRASEAPVPSGFGVQDLFRLGLDDLIKRLDDPIDPVSFYDHKSAQFKTAQVPKVYHLNLVLVATKLDTNEQVKTRTRVIVNQQGIVRLEPLVTQESEQPRP